MCESACSVKVKVAPGRRAVRKVALGLAVAAAPAGAESAT